MKNEKANTSIVNSSNTIMAEVAHINKMVRLRSCEHADISSHDVGRIVEVVDKDGYGVEFTKMFKDGASNKSKLQTNIIYGEAKYVEFI